MDAPFSCTPPPTEVDEKCMHSGINLSDYNTDDHPGNGSSSFYNAGCDHYTSNLGHAGDYVAGICLLFIIMVAVVVNSFVIWSFAARRKMITSVDYYILTLAVNDLCAPVLAYPMAMMSTFSHRWIFGDTGCLINGFLGFFFGIVDIFILSALSITRYICVCHPVASSRLSERTVVLSLAGVMLISALWSVLPLCGWGAYSVEPFGTSCTLQWSTPDRAYVTCVFASCLLLPLLIMATSYGCILRNTSAASRRLRKYKNDTRRATHEMRLIKITILMSVGFLLAWMPYAIVAMLSAYAPPGLQVSGPTTVVPTLLAKTSHISNPVIYFTLNSRLSRHRHYHHARRRTRLRLPLPCCPALPLLWPASPRPVSSGAESSDGEGDDRHEGEEGRGGCEREEEEVELEGVMVMVTDGKEAGETVVMTEMGVGGGRGEDWEDGGDVVPTTSKTSEGEKSVEVNGDVGRKVTGVEGVGVLQETSA